MKFPARASDFVFARYQLPPGNWKARARPVFKLGSAGFSAVISRTAQLVVVALVARLLGPEDFGVYIFAIGTSVVAGMIGAMGWPFAFNRYFAILVKAGDAAGLRGLLRASNLLVLAGSTALALAIFGASFFAGELATGMRAGALLAIPYAFTTLRRQQLAGLGKSPLALLLDQGLASIALCAVILLVELELFEMIAIYGAALVAGNLLATRIVVRSLPLDISATPSTYQLGAWMHSGLSMLLGQSARLLLTRFDVLLMPALAGLAQAGFYGAALRVTYILTFPQFILQTISSPYLARSFADGDVNRARQITWLSFGFACLTTFPFAVGMVVWPDEIMRFLFGNTFLPGSEALVYLTVGQLAIGVGMPFANVLAMSGRERSFGVLNLIVLLFSLALAWAIIPSLGATGGGIVMAIAGVVLFTGQAGLSFGPLGFGEAARKGATGAKP